MKAVLLRPDTPEQDGKTMVLASDVLIREVDLGSVSVPAGGTQVSRNVSLTASDIAAIRDLFPNGSYVEGFVILTAADGSAPQIGMPLLAFLGDWTSAPILDRANWFDEPQDGGNVMNNDCTLGVNVVGSTIRSAGEVVNFLNLGQNIFDTDIAAESKQTVFHQENFAISPDGSGYFDAIDDLELYQLRDAKLFVTEVRNKNTNELLFPHLQHLCAPQRLSGRLRRGPAHVPLLLHGCPGRNGPERRRPAQRHPVRLHHYRLWRG
ncbi:MAG: hypothetical protein V8S77_02070 [Oscillospiraceae bacterium]